MIATEVMRKALEALECLMAEIERLESGLIAPAIPALTIEDVAESAPEFADVPKYGPAYLAGAHWAYTLAAARTGARIIKADPLQELADDAKQIGLEYRRWKPRRHCRCSRLKRWQP